MAPHPKTGMRVALVLALVAGLLLTGLLLRTGPRQGASRALPSPSRRADSTALYTISLNGIPAGTLSTRISQVVEEGRPCLVFEYELAPAASIRRLWDYQLTGRTLIDPESLHARSASINRRSGDNEKTTLVRFEPEAGTALVEVRKSGKDSARHKQIPMDTPLDTPAALMLLGAAHWSPEPTSLRVLNGDDLYEWRVSYLKQERVAVPAGEFQSDVLKVEATKLDVESGPEPVRKGKAQSVLIWLERKTGRPVRATCELSLGTFQVDLVQSQPGQ